MLKMFQFSFDGQNYELVASSKYEHGHTYGLANYKNHAFTTGCNGSGKTCNLKTELFDMETQSWSDGPDYPYYSTNSP